MWCVTDESSLVLHAELGKRRNQQFTLTAAYTEDSPLPEGFDRTIGTFTIGPPSHVPTDSEVKAKLKVKVRCRATRR